MWCKSSFDKIGLLFLGRLAQLVERCIHIAEVGGSNPSSATTMVKISTVILTKNEQSNIKSCLSYLDWCDEILLIDDDSTDRTREIARKLGAKVYQHSLKNNFAQQSNFGLRKAKNDWVLFVDADERVSKSLQKEILQEVEKAEKKDIVGFYLQRRDYFFGRWLNFGEVGKMYFLRLAKKKNGLWQQPVHEIWKIKGKTKKLKNPLLHLPHLTVGEFLKDINFYTNIRAQELFSKGKTTNVWQIIGYPIGKFFWNYFLKLGFLDGVQGLLIALFMSFHSFMVRGKLYLLSRKNV